MTNKTLKLLAYLALALICYALSFKIGNGPASLVFLMVGAIFDVSFWANLFWGESAAPKD